MTKALQQLNISLPIYKEAPLKQYCDLKGIYQEGTETAD
jgi:hypothetical protein